MHEDAAVLVEVIDERFRRRGLTMPEINRRQALVPDGCHRHTEPSRVGTRVCGFPPAPVRWCFCPDHRARWCRCSSRRSWHTSRPAGAARDHAAGSRRGRAQRVVGRRAGGNPSMDPGATNRCRSRRRFWRASAPSNSTCRAMAPTPPALAARLEASVASLADAFGADVVNRDGRSLEQTVGDLLTARGWRLALAESCTGGLVTTRLTDVAGASAYPRPRGRGLQQRRQDATRSACRRRCSRRTAR